MLWEAMATKRQGIPGGYRVMEAGDDGIARGTTAFFYHQMLEKHHNLSTAHTRAGASKKLGRLAPSCWQLSAVWLFPRVPTIFHSSPALDNIWPHREQEIPCDFCIAAR